MVSIRRRSGRTRVPQRSQWSPRRVGCTLAAASIAHGVVFSPWHTHPSTSVDDVEAGTVKIHQAGYCTEVCELFGFDPKVARRESTPEFLGDPASSDKVQPGNVTVENFRQVVGSISFLVQATRPELAHACNRIARAQTDPTPADILNAKKLLRFIAGSVDHGITYTRTKKFVRDYGS
jgi:hypothetical protein